MYIESLNETIDLHEKRVAALENRVPPSVWLLIISVSVIAVLYSGPDAQLTFLGDTRSHPVHHCDCHKTDRLQRNANSSTIKNVPRSIRCPQGLGASFDSLRYDVRATMIVPHVVSKMCPNATV